MKHQDPNSIKKYLQGQSNSQMQHEMEKQSLKDPFLEEAMKGFESDPGALELADQLKREFQAKQSTSKGLSPRNKWIMGTAITCMVALSVYTVILVTGDNGKQDEKLAIQQEVLPQEEEGPESQEIIPQVIEEMNTLPEAEQFNPQEVAKETKEVVESHGNTVEMPTPPGDLPAPPVHMVEEKPEQPKQSEQAEIVRILDNLETDRYIFVHDHKIYDYRGIREAEGAREVEILKPVLGGITADKEGAGSSSMTVEMKPQKVPYHDYLMETMALFDKKKYKRALTRYNIILDHYPEDVNALFYGALCNYNLEQTATAIEQLNLLMQQGYSTFYEEGLWYLAQCYDKLGQSLQAKKLYRRMKKEGGFYANRASAKL